MSLRRLGIIGSGAIATKLVDVLVRELGAPLDALVFLTSARSQEAAAVAFDQCAGRIARECTVTADLGAFLAREPELVAECAGHDSVRDYGPAILCAGASLIVVSTGALCDDDLHHRLHAAAEAGKARLIVSAGALTSLDFLAAARLAGSEQVDYTSRKPPLAWRGTPAEDLVNLDAITAPTAFFEGDARAAASAYPKNANVAATIALAGIGFDRTRVRLVADPTRGGNVHEITLRSSCAEVSYAISGIPSPDNPKTSLSTAYSLAREVLAEVQRGRT